MFSSVVRAPRESGSMTRATGKVLPTAILERHRSSDSHPHGQVLRAARPVGLVIVAALALRRGTSVAPEEGPGRAEDVRAPSAVRATVVLNARQANAANPVAVRALAEAAVDLAAAVVSVEAPVVAAVAEDAGKMKTTGNCRSYRDTLWRERE